MSTTIERARQRADPHLGPRDLGLELLLACGIAYGVVYVIANDVIAARDVGRLPPARPGHQRALRHECAVEGFPARHAARVHPARVRVRRRRLEGRRSEPEAARDRWDPHGPSGAVPGLAAVPDDLAGGARAGRRRDQRHRTRGAHCGRDPAHRHADGVGATAFGKRFQYFSIAMALTLLSAGAYVATTSNEVAAGDPTPWMGLVERASYGAWLTWMAVLAIVLLRRSRQQTSQGPAERHVRRDPEVSPDDRPRRLRHPTRCHRGDRGTHRRRTPCSRGPRRRAAGRRGDRPRPLRRVRRRQRRLHGPLAEGSRRVRAQTPRRARASPAVAVQQRTGRHRTRRRAGP
jgi:hypothetical protein